MQDKIEVSHGCFKLYILHKKTPLENTRRRDICKIDNQRAKHLGSTEHEKNNKNFVRQVFQRNRQSQTQKTMILNLYNKYQKKFLD